MDNVAIVVDDLDAAVAFFTVIKLLHHEMGSRCTMPTMTAAMIEWGAPCL
jgi:hypothetical protein